MTLRAFAPPHSTPPDSYVSFMARLRETAEARGITWDVAVDDRGRPADGEDWDLRLLNGSHQRYRPGTGGFAVDEDLRALAIAAGWPLASLPAPSALSPATRDFIKALLVDQCTRGRTADAAQILAGACRRLFSTTQRAPWELRAEDFHRLFSLKTWSDKAIRDFSVVGGLIDENLLSEHCPVRPGKTAKAVPVMLGALEERKGGEKLPELDALLELTRIVFQETPASHNDAIWFLVLRIVILTGLRIQEVVTLPRDCLVWDEHLDAVTGKPAAEVGGVSKSLRLRYFAGKHRDGAPDLLVEAFQWVPAQFEALVVGAVNEAIAATELLSQALAVQIASPTDHCRSDIRSFTTAGGQVVNTSGRLFLCAAEVLPYPVTAPLREDLVITTPNFPKLYAALGRAKWNGSLSFFKKYGKAPGAHLMSVKPHSLRHLLNTELFRQNVPDTAITHQFGRKTVAQSYEYDHRNLAERLRFVELPAAALPLVKRGSTQELVAKMVVSGVAGSSHIGQSFKRIQAEHGDEAAFRYLAANSDGFHVTPYGFCTNSFSINPCARHLKCFDNCKHFAASGAPEHVTTLSELKERLVAMRQAAAARPATTVGRTNQVLHADKLIAGVSVALAAQPNELVFPGGADHSLPKKDIFK